MIQRAGFIVMLIVATLIAPTSLAQSAEGAEHASGDWREIYFGGRLSWLEVEDVDEGDLNLGAFVGGRILRYVALNGALDYHSADFDLDSRETYALTVSIEAYPMKRKVSVQPYLLAGLGLYESRFEITDCCGNTIIDDTEYEFGVHAGGGLDIIIKRNGSERLALNLELRRIFTDEENEDDQVEPDGTLIGLGLKFRTPR